MLQSDWLRALVHSSYRSPSKPPDLKPRLHVSLLTEELHNICGTNRYVHFDWFPGTADVASHKHLAQRRFLSEMIFRYVSLRLRVQNAMSAQPCVGKFRISLVLLNFLHCNFRLWFETL